LQYDHCYPGIDDIDRERNRHLPKKRIQLSGADIPEGLSDDSPFCF